jgi:hypothetical protein
LTETEKRPPPSAEEWPYNFEEAETRLNLDVIREQGQYFLKRALNIERMVAFVGVGASMAYGRVTWGELALVQIDTISRFFSLDNLKRLGPKLDRRIFSPDNVKRLCNKLHRPIKLLWHLRDDVVLNNSDAIILSMQITEQIWTLCPPKIRDELAKEFRILPDIRTELAEESRIRNTNTTLQDRESGPSYFRTVIKGETVSVRPHIISILSNIYNYSSSDQFHCSDYFHCDKFQCYDKFDCYARSLLSNNFVPKRADILPANSIEDITKNMAAVFSNPMIHAARDSALILSQGPDPVADI